MPMLNKENHPTPAGQTQAAGQRSPGKDQGEDASNVLAAFAKDTGPAADAIRKLLEDPTPEKAAALMKDLPNLIPEDPAMAAEIAEEMSKEFGSTTMANKKGKCRAKDPTKCPVHGNPDKRGKNEPPAYVEDWSESKTKGINSQVDKLAQKSLKDLQSNDVIHLGRIPSKTAIDVLNATKDSKQVDIQGFRQNVAAGRIRHADRRHGQKRIDPDGNMLGETREDQIALTAADWARLGSITSSYDSVKPGSPRQGLPMLQYSKKFDDGEITTVWEVASKKKEIRFYDMWKHTV